MAGHSKWANIKHKKKIKDQQKSKLFSKLANNIKASLKEKQESGDDNKLKNAINKAIDNNLNKEIIDKIILTHNKNNKTDLISFKKNDYIIILDYILDEKNKNISEIKNTLNSYNFKHVENKNVFTIFNKISKIEINNYYNEKDLIKNIYNKINITNFEDDKIQIEYEDLNTAQTILKNKFITFNFSTKFNAKFETILNENEKEEIKILIKKIKKKEFIKNIFSNITL